MVDISSQQEKKILNFFLFLKINKKEVYSFCEGRRFNLISSLYLAFLFPHFSRFCVIDFSRVSWAFVVIMQVDFMPLTRLSDWIPPQAGVVFANSRLLSFGNLKL